MASLVAGQQLGHTEEEKTAARPWASPAARGRAQPAACRLHPVGHSPVFLVRGAGANIQVEF